MRRVVEYVSGPCDGEVRAFNDPPRVLRVPIMPPVRIEDSFTNVPDTIEVIVGKYVLRKFGDINDPTFKIEYKYVWGGVL